MKTIAKEPRGGRLPRLEVHALEVGQALRRDGGVAPPPFAQAEARAPGQEGPGARPEGRGAPQEEPGRPGGRRPGEVRMAGLSMRCRACLRILRREGFTEPYRTNPKRKRGRPCQTPPCPGDKRRAGVKSVPEERRAPGLEGRFYQYAVLDEASRRRYLRFSDERSMREAVRFFGYAPRVLQTDNGKEFSGRASRKEGAPGARAWPNALEAELARHGTVRKLVRPRTPEHNGKAGRSHRIGQEKSCRTLSFHSLGDLRRQGAAWLRRHDSWPRPVLGMRSPDEAEVAKLRELHGNEGEARCLRLLRRFTSSVT